MLEINHDHPIKYSPILEKNISGDGKVACFECGRLVSIRESYEIGVISVDLMSDVYSDSEIMWQIASFHPKCIKCHV